MPPADSLLNYTLPAGYGLSDISDTRGNTRNLLRAASRLLQEAARHVLPEISIEGRAVAEPSDATFRGIRPALRILSSRRCVEVCRALLRENESGSWSEDELAKLTEWNVHGENLVLLAMGAMARTGVVKQLNGNWTITDFGRQMAIFWMRSTPLDMMSNLWSARVRVAHLDALQWAWETLSLPQTRPLLNAMLASPDGFPHDQLPSNDFGREDTLRTVAAAAAIGAVWFTGWRWEATLYGSWLINHPDSPLQRR